MMPTLANALGKPAFGGTAIRPQHRANSDAAEEVVPPSASNGGKSREVTITHPDKVFWPKEGYTKADLVDYLPENRAIGCCPT